jgi:hypothetical protein
VGFSGSTANPAAIGPNQAELAADGLPGLGSCGAIRECMTDPTIVTTNRRDYMKTAGAIGIAGLAGLSGCLGGGTAPGTLATKVKDAPGDISDFETCVVTIEGFWLKPASDGDSEDDQTTSTDDSGTTTSGDGVQEQDESDVDQSDAREYHEFDEAQQADLVQLQNGDTQLVDETDIEVGTYAFLQLDVSGVDATLDDGSDADVGTPGEAPLQFKEQFEIREGQRTTFTADFTPVKRGQTGKYLLQPVATGTEVTYSEESDSE